MSTGEGLDGIVDDARSHRFVLETDAGLAELVYRVNGSRLVVVHTEVPETLRGRGIAGRLVRAAVERAAAAGLIVVPRCPYARSWLEEHPEAAATVAVDWGA